MQLCELCGERPGIMNSNHWTDDDYSYDGHWVCGLCEKELEEQSGQWNCPCGCDGPENCVYSKATLSEVTR